jgi:hypothetical protein
MRHNWAMKFWSPTAALFIAAGTLFSASIAFVFTCDMQSGFLMQPNVHKQIGYVTAFQAFGAPALSGDLALSVPFTPLHELLTMTRAPGLPPVTNVVGVIENFSWSGGLADPLKITFFVSKENAILLNALQQTSFKTDAVSSLGWWIGNYDPEAKVWFEAAYPASSPTVSGTFPNSSALSVSLTPVPVADGIDVNVYAVSIQVFPTPHSIFSLLFANSSRSAVIKSWGSL